EPSHDLGPLVAALDAGKVKLLVVLEGNPCYGAPADLELTTRFTKVENSVYLGAYQDETAVATRWFVPARHYLESWGDARAYDGTVSLIQPLVRPLVAGGRTPIDMLAVLAGVAASNQDLVRGTWKGQRTSGSFELFWQTALKKGIVDDSALPAVSPRVPPEAAAPPAARAGMEVVGGLDPKIFDGRFGGNAWLQELPAPMSKLTWGNAALISTATARKLDVETGDRVEIVLAGRK